MVPIGKDYYYHEGKIFKEIKPCGLSVPRWKLKTKTGQRKWISLKQIQEIIDSKDKR